MARIKAYYLGEFRCSSRDGIGQSASFDCTKIPNYKSLKTNNFFFTDIECMASELHTYGKDATCRPKLSYNSNSGVFTITSINKYEDEGEGRTGVALSHAKVYVIPNIIF